MQFIGTDQILRDLCDASVVGCRQKFRADRRIQNILQRPGKRSLTGTVRLLGGIAYQMPYQRFGHRSIDGVHGHMVAVVGRPAQRQLGEVAGSDDQSGFRVGDIHQYLRALTCLRIFIDHVAVLRIVPDVGKMPVHGIGNIDRPEIHAKLPAECFGVGSCAHGCAEAGHGHGDDIPAGASEPVGGAHHAQQCQAGIQSA